MIDSTNLRLDATASDIQTLCAEAVELGCACVMIYPTSVQQAREVLAGTGMAIGTVIGFPSGRFSTAAKIAEIEHVAVAGSQEVDIVMNYAALRDGNEAQVAKELAVVTRRAHELGQRVKVITENCYLSEAQILTALRLCEDANVDFIKTSTGFGSAGAKVEHIALWARSRRGAIQIKAAGGIKTLPDAVALIEAGAARLGTSNASALVKALRSGGASASEIKGGY